MHGISFLLFFSKLTVETLKYTLYKVIQANRPTSFHLMQKCWTIELSDYRYAPVYSLLSFIKWIIKKTDLYCRPLTMGEIGCFLSHYFIWEDVSKKN